MRSYLTLFLLSAFLPVYAEESPSATSEEKVEKAVVSAEVSSDSSENVKQAEKASEKVPTVTSEEETEKAVLSLEKSTKKSEKTGDSGSTKVPTVVTDSLNNFLKQTKESTTISPAAVNGLYEVVMGSEVFYVSADGNYAIIGDIRDTRTGENVTDSKRAELRMKEVSKLDESTMVVFTPEKETKYTINAFTDVDCGYCAKLHQGMKEMNDLGIKVRYLAFPRAGVGSKTYNTMVSVWCADDQQKAMTDAKQGKNVPAKKCKNPVDKHYELGRKIGVRGTPALLLSDGELLPGYVPPKRLINYLEGKAKEKAGNTEKSEEARKK